MTQGGREGGEAMTHTPEPWIVKEVETTHDELVRPKVCLAACAGIPIDKLRPGIVKELIAASRLARGVVPVGGSGVYKYVDAEPLRALLRELGEP